MVGQWVTCLLMCITLTAACRDEPTPEGEVAKPRRAIVPLVVLKDTLAICRLESNEPLPAWARVPAGEFFSSTRTPREQSIILPDGRAPREAKCERGWRAFVVKGPLEFSLVGIVAGLSGTLADAGISIFALSTYDTDYIMVKQVDLDRATGALRRAGYPLEEEPR